MSVGWQCAMLTIVVLKFVMLSLIMLPQQDITATQLASINGPLISIMCRSDVGYIYVYACVCVR